MSINSALLRAAAKLAAPEMTATVLNGLGEVPLFDPDHEASSFGTVATFRSCVANADALLVASPEYAQGKEDTIQNLWSTSTCAKRQGRWRMLGLQMQQRATK